MLVQLTDSRVGLGVGQVKAGRDQVVRRRPQESRNVDNLARLSRVYTFIAIELILNLNKLAVEAELIVRITREERRVYDLG